MKNGMVEIINGDPDGNNPSRQVIRIPCKDEKELDYAREFAMAAHAMSGYLFKLFDSAENLEGDTEFLEDLWKDLNDLWGAEFQIYKVHQISDQDEE